MDSLQKFHQGITLKKSITLTITKAQQVRLIGQRVFSISNATPHVIQTLQKIAVGVKIEELASLLSKENLEQLIDLLDSKQLVRPLYTNKFQGTRVEKQVDFFSDFVLDPNTAQERIFQTSVCVIGCGGTGNVAVQHLVAAGFKKFILIDSDTVNITNFNRQFCFDNSHLNTLKAEVVKNYILNREPEAEVDIRPVNINSVADLHKTLEKCQKPDVILCCADTPPIAIHSLILDYCIQENIMCTFGSVGVYEGYIGPLLIESSHMNNFLQHTKYLQEELILDNLNVISSSISYLNTLIATLMTADVIDLISQVKIPSSLNATLKYNTVNNNLTKIREW
ncbi:ThiF family adenylyltransferase [Scytonema hofmannii FACHB-248]|uniref:ThiF family adenylyltransferase n=1 Tax=Scytonema hofmannii FACHB-248 TaxID=1842502 RepID=A0ABR8GWB6_9CYAN|nr:MULTISPECIES: ThiF family adenylyltransferase [Nostocales]MBD2607448.1 ThiF family adenylyltransferase [Scytonema hofmannii FACHB-248]